MSSGADLPTSGPPSGPAPLAAGQERWQQLDFLRGLAIVAVVLIHLAARVPASHGWAFAAQWLDHFCRFGVPLFLAAHTAMVVRRALGVGPRRAGLRLRWRTVVVPYLLWSALYAGLGLLDGQWQPPATAAGWLYDLTLGYTAEQLWFMPAYLGALVLVPLWAALVRGWARAPGRWPWLAGMAVLLAAAQLAGQVWLVAVSSVDRAPPPLAGWLLRAEGRSPLHWIGCLGAGVGIGAALARGWRPPPWSRWLALPALALHAWVALRPPQAPRFDDFWCSPAMSGGFALFLLWAWPLAQWSEAAAVPVVRWVYNGLSRLGRDSLPLYLAHVAWLRLAWWAVGETWPLPAALAAAALAVVAGSWAYFPVHAAVFGRSPRLALGA